jgi:hypothetical protein
MEQSRVSFNSVVLLVPIAARVFDAMITMIRCSLREKERERESSESISTESFLKCFNNSVRFKAFYDMLLECLNRMDSMP